jgi:hypothetical protein
MEYRFGPGSLVRMGVSRDSRGSKRCDSHPCFPQPYLINPWMVSLVLRSQSIHLAGPGSIPNEA